MASDDFPRYFEGQYASYTEDIPFWVELGRESGGPVLELGCGYGRVLRALADEGISATGIDRDPGMLDRASAYVPAELRHLVTLHQADIRDFTLEGPFPLAISPCNTFSSLTDDEFHSAASSAARHLSPGGRLVLDLPFDTGTTTQPTEVTKLYGAFNDIETGNPVQVSSLERTESEGARIHVTWLYDELLPDGRVERTEVPMTFHMRAPEALSRLLSAAGFPSVEFFDDEQRHSYRPGSDRMIVFASIGP